MARVRTALLGALAALVPVGLLTEPLAALFAAVALATVWVVVRVRAPAELQAAYLAIWVAACTSLVLGLYDRWSWLDTVFHVSLPAVAAPIAYLVLVRLGVAVAPAAAPRRWAVALACLAVGLGIGAAWEVLEWTSDELLGSDLQLGLDDTVGDLVADGSGALVGGALFARLRAAP